jgi:hypothetical protein
LLFALRVLAAVTGLPVPVMVLPRSIHRVGEIIFVFELAAPARRGRPIQPQVKRNWATLIQPVLSDSKSACRAREFAHNTFLIERGGSDLPRAFSANVSLYYLMNWRPCILWYRISV